MIKILMTCVGRRVELIECFCNAAKRLNVKLEMWGADVTKTAPALQFCQKQVIVPAIKDSLYIPSIKRICEEENIDVLIPTIDTDLLLLAKNKDKFGKTKVVISNQEKILLPLEN